MCTNTWRYREHLTCYRLYFSTSIYHHHGIFPYSYYSDWTIGEVIGADAEVSVKLEKSTFQLIPFLPVSIISLSLPDIALGVFAKIYTLKVTFQSSLITCSIPQLVCIEKTTTLFLFWHASSPEAHTINFGIKARGGCLSLYQSSCSFMTIIFTLKGAVSYVP